MFAAEYAKKVGSVVASSVHLTICEHAGFKISALPIRLFVCLSKVYRLYDKLTYAQSRRSVAVAETCMPLGAEGPLSLLHVVSYEVAFYSQYSVTGGLLWVPQYCNS